MGLGGVAIAVPPYVIHPKTAVLGRAGGGKYIIAHLSIFVSLFENIHQHFRRMFSCLFISILNNIYQRLSS